MIVAIDFETTYVKGVRDISSMGATAYLMHPDMDIYLVSFWVDEFTHWVGPPEKAPWSVLKDADTVVIHNAAFDLRVLRELRRRGLLNIPEVEHKTVCSANLCAYLQLPRSLAGAAEVVLGIRPDKSVRDNMNKKTWADLDDGQKKDVEEYALKDSEICHQLYSKLIDLWPAEEQAISTHTIKMCMEGVAVDRANLEVAECGLKQAIFQAQQDIPWAGELDAKGKPIPLMSPKAMRRACEEVGIEPPASVAVNNDIFQKWAETNIDKAPFIPALQTIRSLNRTLKVVEAMDVREIDGVMSYDLKYCGAPHTTRWSGDSGLNVHNFPRGKVANVDLRSLLVPRPGHKFVTCDLSQVEARVLLWLAGDEGMLQMLRDGYDLYEAHARATMGYDDPRPLKEGNPEMRHLAKARVLGLGFGCGDKKFVVVAKVLAGIDVDPQESKQIVKDWRARNTAIVQLWRTLENGLEASGRKKETYEVGLPAGDTIRYFDVAQGDRGWSGRVVRNDPRRKNLYGGLLAENATQRTARNVLRDAVLKLDSEGFRVVLHVHDEVVVEVPADGAERARARIEEIMSTAPEWAKGLPLAAESEVRDCYGK